MRVAYLAVVGFGFILIVPLLRLIVASPLSLGARYLLFLVGSSVLLSMVVHQLVVISVLSQKRDVLYPAILDRSPLLVTLIFQDLPSHFLAIVSC